MKIEKLKRKKKKNPGSRLDVANWKAQLIQPNLSEDWLDWLCYLAGNSQMAPTIFFKLSVYIFLIISLRTHKPQSPSHFWHIIFQL